MSALTIFTRVDSDHLNGIHLYKLSHNGVLERLLFFQPKEEPKPKPKPIVVRKRSFDYLDHRDEALAMKHAEELERMTGDHCEVRKFRASHYKVMRRDASGKLVLNRTF